MNDILFGNNNSKVITKLSKRYFKKNKVRNLAALLAIIFCGAGRPPAYHWLCKQYFQPFH